MRPPVPCRHRRTRAAVTPGGPHRRVRGSPPRPRDPDARRQQVSDDRVLPVGEPVAAEHRVAPVVGVPVQPGRNGVETVPGEVEVRRRILAERPARGEEPERGQQDHHPQRDQDPRPAEPGRSRQLGVGLGDRAVVDPQQRQIRALQVGEDAERQDQLDAPGHRQVGQRHRGDRRAEVERGVERRSVGAAEQRRLQAELDGRAQRRRVEPRVGTEPGAQRASRRGQRRPAGDHPVDAVSDERHHERHVEGVGTVGQHAAITEEQGLDEQGDRHRDRRRPRTQDHRDEDCTNGMGRRPVGDRDIEHHHQERVGRTERHQRDIAVAHNPLDPAGRRGPHRHHRRTHHRTGRRAQIPVRNVHGRSARNRGRRSRDTARRSESA